MRELARKNKNESAPSKTGRSFWHLAFLLGNGPSNLCPIYDPLCLTGV